MKHVRTEQQQEANSAAAQGERLPMCLRTIKLDLQRGVALDSHIMVRMYIIFWVSGDSLVCQKRLRDSHFKLWLVEDAVQKKLLQPLQQLLRMKVIFQELLLFYPTLHASFYSSDLYIKLGKCCRPIFITFVFLFYFNFYCVCIIPAVLIKVTWSGNDVENCLMIDVSLHLYFKLVMLSTSELSWPQWLQPVHSSCQHWHKSCGNTKEESKNEGGGGVGGGETNLWST